MFGLFLWFDWLIGIVEWGGCYRLEGFEEYGRVFWSERDEFFRVKYRVEFYVCGGG